MSYSLYVLWYTVHSIVYTCDLMLARIWLLGLCPFINWVLHFESGHVRYRKPSPPITSGVRIRPSLTRFLRIEPGFMFLGRFGTFPLLCHVDMPNGRLAYVLPLVTYSHRFSTIFILPWFVCTRMDIVPCVGAMYNISNRNEPFPFHCGPFPFFV